MPDDFRISDLPTSADFNNLDLMEISQVDEDSLSGYTSVKKTMNQIGDKLNNSIEYSVDLNTTDKKIIGAINELLSAINDVADDIPANSDFSLSGLSDTTITTPSSGQVISYDGGKWKNKGAEDFKNDITYNEVTASGTGAYKVANMVFITYQGQSQAHSAGDTLFVIPTGYRPIQNFEAAFTVDGKAYGQVHILANGNVNINNISDNTVTGRIYFSVAYPIA